MFEREQGIAKVPRVTYHSIMFKYKEFLQKKMAYINNSLFSMYCNQKYFLYQYCINLA